MISGAGRGVQLVQPADDQADGAQDIDPPAVAGMEPGPAAAREPDTSRWGRSSARPAGPSVCWHMTTRTLRVRKTSRPPGRRSRDASGIHRTGSQYKLAPHPETARSKLALASGTWPASPSINGNRRPNWSWQRRAVRSRACVMPAPAGRAP